MDLPINDGLARRINLGWDYVEALLIKLEELIFDWFKQRY